VLDTGKVTSSAYPYGYYRFDIATSPQANWGIVAWSNPAGESYLSAFIHRESFDDNRSVSNEIWTSSSSRTAVQSMAITIDQNRKSGVTSQTISQNGIPNADHCVTAGGDPLENDFFVAANSKTVDPNYPSAYLSDKPDPPPNPSLDRVSAITINGWVQVLSATATASSVPCAVNQSAMIYALVFNNKVKHQTLFYQLDLNWFCYARTHADHKNWCQETVPRMNYFMTGQGDVWGIDDPINNYINHSTNRLYSLLQNESLQEIDINFLPRIAQLIHTAQHGMDHDLSHWQWGSFYYGQHTWGNAALVSKWMSPNFSPEVVYSPPR